MAHLYIIRGASGSGKTTLAQSMTSAKMVDVFLEADHFMVDADGRYDFNPSKLRDCHEKCRVHVLKALNAGLNVAVSNTFTRIWEMQPYIEMGHPFTVIRCEGNYENVHGVPAKKVEEMRKRFEPWPPTTLEETDQ